MKKLLSLLLMIMITCSVGIAYATGAGDTQTVTSLKYVTDELNTRQDKFGANDGKAMTFTNVAGGNAPRDVKSSLGTSTSDTGLPTVSAVNAGLDDKQNTIPAVNTNTVMTYTGVAGTVGQKGIYQDTGTYAAQADNLIDAGTFNTALKTGLDSEFICAGYSSTGECWLWSIHNDGESVNLFDKNAQGVMLNGFPNGSGVWTSGSGFRSIIYKLVEGNTYTITRVTSDPTQAAMRVIAYTTGTPSTASATVLSIGSSTTKTATITVPTGYPYILTYVKHSNDVISDQNLLDGFQIESGSTATPYQQHSPYTTLVPAGYTPLEYIDTGNTAGAYIDTGVTYDSTKEIVVNLTAQANSSSVSIMTVLGFGGNYGQLLGVNADGKWSIGTGGVSNISALNKTSDIEVKWNDGIQYLKIGGVNVGTHDITNVGTKLNLFGRLGEGTFKGKIYFAQVIVDGEIVHSFVPAKNSSNVVGMYDTVTGTFFTNAATSGNDFTAGPAISNVVYIPQGQ